MATYEPFLIYTTRFSTRDVGGYETATALPVSVPDPEFVTCFFDVPEVASLDEFAVAIWAEFADLQGLEVQVYLPNEDAAQRAYWPLSIDSPSTGGNGADLGTSDGDAVFDFDNNAPPYYDDDTWTYNETPPLVGRWLAASWTGDPSGGDFAAHMGSTIPASDTTLGSSGQPLASWAVVFKFLPVETSSGVFEQLPVTVHRTSLTINEPYDYGGGSDPDADTFDPATGGTSTGVSGTGKPGISVGSGGVSPVATGAAAPPSGGIGGGSAGGLIYPAVGGRPASRDVDGLVFRVTGMYRPDGTMTASAVLLPDFTDGEVEIPSYNDARTARVTVSMGAFDGVQSIRARERMLQVWFRGVLVFWGTIVTRSRNFQAGTITFAARDPSLRLERHFLRAGDLDGTVDDIQGHTFPLAVDGIGMRLLRDAADNTPDQDTAEYPVLGIANGDLYEPDTAGLMEVRRGDQVWSQMQTSASHMIGPEFRLRPTADDAGAYVKLDTYERIGNDRTAAVGFDCGWGLDNAENIEHEEGAQLITHAHSLDRDLKYRFTEANTTAAALYGVYVEWDATEYDTETISEEQAETILRAHARAILGAYSRPLETIKITPRAGAAARFIYLRDFYDGDTLRFAAKRGYDSVYGTARVIKVTLTDPGNNVVKQSLETVSSFVPDIELGGSEDA